MRVDSRSLQVFSASKIGGNAKVTVHATGKVIFSKRAEVLLNLNREVGIIFAKAPDESGYKSLFCILSSRTDENAFSMSRTGDYYQVNAKNLLDLLGIQYVERNYVYSVSHVEDKAGRKVFKLTLRKESLRKRKPGVPVV